MEVSKPKEMLIVVVLLDSICTGIVAPVLSTHVMRHKGTFLHTGIIGSASLLCNLASQVLITVCEVKYQRKKAILTHMLLAIVTYALLMLFTNVWMVCLCRCIFSLTNRIEVSCKKFLLEVCQSSSPLELSYLTDIATVSGIVYGAIFGGYLYNWANCITYNAMVALMLTVINIGCLHLIDDDCDSDADPDYFDSIKNKCKQKWHNLKQFDFMPYWDVIMLTTVYTGCTTIFFLKFPTLVKFNYNVGIVVAGYTIAHHNMLIFASKCIVPHVKENFPEYWSKIVFEECLVFCSLLLMGLLYAPFYECYLIIFIPLVFMRTLVDNLWENSIPELAADKVLQDVCSTLNAIIGISSPLAFGIVAHFFGLRISFLALNLLPIAVGVYFIHRRYFKLKED